MIPRVFISSTVSDLRHLREAIRDLIVSLGYEPVMSEEGGVGYSPSTSAVDACYSTATTCHLGIVVIGKRYGQLDSNEKSITHNEIEAMHKAKIPVYLFLDAQVKSNYSVYKANTNASIQYPEMDQPDKTFQLISQYYRDNYAVLEYRDATNLIDVARKQLAHLVGDLLIDRYSKTAENTKDILSEIQAIRHAIESGRPETRQASNELREYARTAKFLLDEEHSLFRLFVTAVELYSKKDTVATLNESTSFREFVRLSGAHIQIVTPEQWKEEEQRLRETNQPPAYYKRYRHWVTDPATYRGETVDLVWWIPDLERSGPTVKTTEQTLEWAEETFRQLVGKQSSSE